MKELKVFIFPTFIHILSKQTLPGQGDKKPK